MDALSYERLGKVSRAEPAALAEGHREEPRGERSKVIVGR
jgi:hypothetical protein